MAVVVVVAVLGSPTSRRPAIATALLLMNWFYSLQSFKRHDRFVRWAAAHMCGWGVRGGGGVRLLGLVVCWLDRV